MQGIDISSEESIPIEIVLISLFFELKPSILDIMFVVSSVGSIGKTNNPFESVQPENADGIFNLSDGGSIFEDDLDSDPSGESVLFDEDGDGESCGGTIIVSLSSKEVAQNLIDTVDRNASSIPTGTETKPHPSTPTQKMLSEVETGQSEALSFTPTMVEHALSQQFHEITQRRRQSPASSSSVTSEEEAVPTIGITNLQPERVCCPFCEHEKQLQWRLSKEKEESQGLKISEYKTRFILWATVITFILCTISFFVGKEVSDRNSKMLMAQYKNQCSDLLQQREDDEIYWKLVSAAFSATIHGIAGPLANYVIGNVVQAK